MAVRNWWIQGEVDGRRTNLAAGPRAKNGGFKLTVLQRDEGAITTALSVWAHAKADGRLTLEVREGDTGRTLYEHETIR